MPKGLGQDVSSADDIELAVVIAGDTSKHLSLAPVLLTPSGHVWEVPSRIDDNRQKRFFRRQTFDLLPYPAIDPRAVAVRKFLPLPLDGLASIRSSLPAMAWRVDYQMAIREDIFFENITPNIAVAKFLGFLPKVWGALSSRPWALAFLCLASIRLMLRKLRNPA